MEKKTSSAARTMGIISLIIIVLGVLCAAALYSVLTAEIAHGADSQLIVGETDIVPIVGKAGNAGATVLSGVIVFGSFALVFVQWVCFAVVKIIKSVSNKS